MDYDCLYGNEDKDITDVFHLAEVCSDAISNLGKNITRKAPMIIRKGEWLYDFMYEMYKNRVVLGRGIILKVEEMEKVRIELQGYMDFLSRKYAEIGGNVLL